MNYQLDADQFKELEKRLAAVPDKAEDIVNDIIHRKGGPAIINSILRFMPRSSLKKRHAKDSDSLVQANLNLGVKVFEKAAFGYLVFPELGIGKRQARKGPQSFMQDGLAAEDDTLFKWILEALEEHSNI